MRRHGVMWWGVWAIGVLFVSCYIAFDLLDLDGSQLQTRAGVTLTASSSSAEVSRFLRGAPSPFTVSTSLAMLATHGAVHRLTPASALRREHVLARHHVIQDYTHGPAPSSDPL